MTMKLLRRRAPTMAAVCLLVSCGGLEPDEEVAATADEAQLAQTFVRNSTRAVLLVDNSGSMQNAVGFASCPYYEATYGVSGGFTYTNMDVVRAGLLGCATANDGFLRRYHPGRIALMQIDDSFSDRLLTPFGSTRAAHVAAAAGLFPTGGTPLVTALGDAGAYFGSYFFDGNVRPGTPFVVIVIADGQANGPSETYSFACDGSSVLVPGDDPVPGAQYIASRDTICALAGEQHVHVHTIAVGNGPAAMIEAMRDLAKAGDGSFASVTQPTDLSDQLLDIILNP